MPPRLLHPDEYELVSRSSFESKDSFDLDDDDFEAQATPTGSAFLRERPSRLRRLVALLPVIGPRLTGIRRPHPSRRGHQPSRCLPRLRIPIPSRTQLSLPRFSIKSIADWTVILLLTLIIFTALFRPSYTHPPAHYVSRREAALASDEPGRANPMNETVFIAASLYDPRGEVVNGEWGDCILRLIDLLGERNVFLSIYESNSGDAGKEALQGFEKKLKCNSSILYEPSMNADGVQKITLPDGTKRVKRIAYLAAARNRALDVLDHKKDLPQFDRLLYVNDIIFDPIDATQLLFSTNVDKDGVAQYRAACATDFINSFKFYDTFATRDLDGYSMGVPFYPWFSSVGKAESREDVLSQKDAVRVRSCWGGMVAFDAKYFQTEAIAAKDTVSTYNGTEKALVEKEPQSPARFRAEHDTFWDASECCLIHADIQKPPYEFEDQEHIDTGIYMNPYIRVAYDAKSLSWLGFTRRFERLYSPVQAIVSRVASLPRYNSRRLERAGEKVKDVVFVPSKTAKNGGEWETVERVAGTGGFCGRRGVQVMREHPQKGQKNWEELEIPPGSLDL